MNKEHKNIKKIAYSILDLAVVPKGSSINDTIKNTVALAQNAEEFGYTRYWLAEHHNMPAIASSATSILIGRVAEATKTIKVGSGGIMLPNHSPLIVAEQFGTLGTMYPNRIDLGLGRAPGTDQETARAIRSDFISASQSFPEEIEKIQTYFDANNKDAKVRAPIAEGVNVPIFILGSSTDSAHLAAKKGFPYAFASHFATAQLLPALEIYRNEFIPSSVLEKPYVITGVNAFIADTDEEAERMATSFIKMIVSLLTGAKREALEEACEMTQELRDTLGHPTVQQMTRYTFIGSKNKVKKQLQDFLIKTGADELIVSTNCHNQTARIKSYQLLSEIITEINDAN